MQVCPFTVVDSGVVVVCVPLLVSGVFCVVVVGVLVFGVSGLGVE